LSRVSGTAARTQPADDTTPQGKVPILCIVIFLKYSQVHITNVKYYIIQTGHDTVPQSIWQVGRLACNTSRLVKRQILHLKLV
jgi:hypothetical protein